MKLKHLSFRLLLVFVTGFLACKKQDIIDNRIEQKPSVEKFLFVPTNADPILSRIITKIKQQEEKYSFLNKIISREGYAKWENAKIIIAPATGKSKTNSPSTYKTLSGNSSDTVILVPLVLENTNYVNSFIACRLDDTVSIKLYSGRAYSRYGFNKPADSISAQKIAATCMELEFEAFGHSIFNVKDKRLFNYLPDNKVPNRTLIRFKKRDNSSNKWVTIFFDYDIDVVNDNGELVGCPPGDPCNGAHTETHSDSYTFWIDSDDDIPGPGSTIGADIIPWQGYDPCSGYVCTPVLESWQYVDASPSGNSLEGYDFTWPPFFWSFSSDNGETYLDPDPSKEPNFQFDVSDNYENLYPRFTNMVKNLKTFVKNNPIVLNALQRYSGFTKTQILNNLTYSQGPTIKVEEMSGRFGYYNKDNGSKTLHIRASYVRGLEQSFLESTKQATAFLLAVTILHEYVHLGTTVNGISEGVYDFGTGFERDAFNVTVDDDNAGTVVIKFSKWFL